MTSPYLLQIPRSEEQCIREAQERQRRRMPLGHNENVPTDIGPYGRDDIDATLPLVETVIPLVGAWKKELEAFKYLAAKNGRAGPAAFNDPVEWLGDALEDLQRTQQAFVDALRE